MSQKIQAPTRAFQYTNFCINKTQCLGHGAYGAVYQASCDQLPCAAKVLHPTIVDPYDPGAGKILQRFEQECGVMSSIRHPHIVQYLGLTRDPETRLPVLLMELLDESLTRMLERSKDPLPYSIQVDLCHDITLAISYLHSNGIIHRDLSSNNVLIMAGRRAKVTDFGMLKIIDSAPRMTPLTMCPGTLAYMPPEALDDQPRYTEKMDSFSFGVLSIQICTRLWPEPGPRTKKIRFTVSPTGTMEIPVVETERRKTHIELIDPTHPLLTFAIPCLNYNEGERPTDRELCQMLVVLKEALKYKESVGLVQRGATPSHPSDSAQIRQLQVQQGEANQQIKVLREDNQRKETTITEQMHEIQQLQQEKDQISGDLNRQIQSKDQQLREKDWQLREKDQQLREKDRIITARDDQLQGSEEVIAEFQRTNYELQKQIEDQQDEANQQIKVLREDNQRKETTITEQTQEIQQLQQERDQLSRDFNRQIQSKDQQLREKDQQLREKDRIRDDQLQGSEEVIAEFQRTNYELQKQIEDQQHEANQQIKVLPEDNQQQLSQQVLSPRSNVIAKRKERLKLIWRNGGKAPMRKCRGASVVDGNVAYFRYIDQTVSYNSATQTWDTLPKCPLMYGSLAIVRGLLTMIGGKEAPHHKVTNKLFSLESVSKERKWVNQFPSMPIKCYDCFSTSSGKYVIIAGGTINPKDNHSMVQVLYTESLVWSTAASLPHPLADASAVVCGNRIYILGESDHINKSKSMFMCSLTELLQSCQPHTQTAQAQVWNRAADLPVYRSTCATVNGQLLAIGGRDEYDKDTKALHKYNPITDSWEIISHMSTARNLCFVAVLPSFMMIVGGYGYGAIDSIEIAETE